MNVQTQAVAIAEVPRRSVLIDMATRYGMEPAAFEQTLRATVVPKDCSREQFAAFLLVAKEYNLNPMTKEIYAFPTRGGGIQPIVSIDGWCNLVNSHPQCDGIEFDDHLSADGNKVDAITARIWRKDRKMPVIVTEYFAECNRNTDPWKQYPRRMLRHKALIQCARYAFGFSGIVDPDEAERIAGNGAHTKSIDHDDGPPDPPMIEHQDSAPTDQVVWEEQGERPATPEDFDGIPPELDRRNGKKTATAADVFDAAQFLRDVEGAASGCEDFASLAEIDKKMVTSQLFPPDFQKAKRIIAKHYARVSQTVMSAG